jgi:hypothetical protein
MPFALQHWGERLANVRFLFGLESAEIIRRKRAAAVVYALSSDWSAIHPDQRKIKPETAKEKFTASTRSAPIVQIRERSASTGKSYAAS